MEHLHPQFEQQRHHKNAKMLIFVVAKTVLTLECIFEKESIIEKCVLAFLYSISHAAENNRKESGRAQ